eukprot:TRINITY_DN128_c0_g1_i1.p3 TRINITY_DN128_c0_g1~~TRINITY_DN128_c0_g1_i1.p3  ORF type:complete len:72 (+),score=38.18 TRINITY_DN128_c0_g1_i1:446-661(+)
MKELEGLVRGLNIAGLTWGASKLLPVAYGVKKLQIMATVLDDDFSGDDMEEQILGLEDHVQSMDIQAWNKL